MSIPFKKLRKEETNDGIVIKLMKKNNEYHYVSDNMMESSETNKKMTGNKRSNDYVENSKIKIALDLGQNTSNFNANSNNSYTGKKNLRRQIDSNEEQNNDFDMVLALEEDQEAKYIKDKKDQIKKMPILIPSCSQWFDLEKIHEIEINAMPEYFCNKYPLKTPHTYKESRNFIISLYRENPNVYLSATACRRYLYGDVCAIMRIHAFLEGWGLINFNVDPKYLPVNPYSLKSNTYKNSIYIDSTMFNNKKDESGQKIGNNKLVITHPEGGDLRNLYPSTTIPYPLFRNIFSSNVSSSSQLNFISQNYTPKCDLCAEICGFNFYIEKNEEKLLRTNTIIICEKCFMSMSTEDSKYEDIKFQNLNKNQFEPTCVYNILTNSDKGKFL